MLNTLRRPRFTPPRQTEIILFDTRSFHLPTGDSCSHDGSSAIRPFTSMLGFKMRTVFLLMVIIVTLRGVEMQVGHVYSYQARDIESNSTFVLITHAQEFPE